MDSAHLNLQAFSEAPLPLDPTDLRRCLGAFVTGITVITTIGDDGKPYGMTANSFNSVSLDPPLILWSLRRKATNYTIFHNARRSIVNILAEDQIDISQRFSKSGGDPFAGLPAREGLDGIPMIEGCAANLECHAEESYPDGDHVILLCRVARIHNSGRKPLAFGHGKYMVVHPHDASSREGGAGTNDRATLHSVQLARPIVEELSCRTGRTVGLAVWGSNGPTVIWWAEGKIPANATFRPGMIVSPLTSAAGQVFSAFLPADIVRPIINAELARNAGLDPRFFLKTISEADAILGKVRLSGLGGSLPLSETHPLKAFGVPVFNETGTPVLAMTMLGEAKSFVASDPAVLSLRAEAAKLSRRLGFHEDR